MRRSPLQWTGILVGAGVLLGAVGLMAIAFLSLVLPPRTSPLGEEKRISGPGTHLLVSVVEVERDAAWHGDERLEPRIDGVAWRFRVRVRNDAAGAAHVIDPGRVRVVAVGAEAFDPLAILDGDGAVNSLAGSLLQGQERVRDFYFDLPRDVERPRLWVYPDDVLSRYLPFGRKNLLTPKLVYAHP